MQKVNLRVLLIGIGRIGKKHAAAYQQVDGFSLAGVCGRDHQREYAARHVPEADFYLDGQDAISAIKPDVVCVSTHVDTHDLYTRAAIESGAHVFLEKPAAETLEKTRELFQYANERHKKILVGYVRRHDALWKAFVATSKTVGSPVVIRFSLDQPSVEEGWEIHKSILKRTSLTFDCAVHFVDMMSKICDAPPVAVTAKSVRLHDDPEVNDNYGFLSVEFADRSVGSYESLWGPMASRSIERLISTAGPAGSVSIARVEDNENRRSDAVIREPKMVKSEASVERQIIALENQEEAFVVQQRYLLECIRENKNMDEHYADVIASMKIVIAADESAAQKATVHL